MKIAVNGLGRIGRNIIRAAIKKNVSIVAINDIMDIKLAAYLLKHDTIRGALDVEILDNETLKIEDNIVTYTTFLSPNETQFHEADIVFECSGKFLTTNDAIKHIKGNVKKVIISAPANDDTPTFVLGVYHKNYKDYYLYQDFLILDQDNFSYHLIYHHRSIRKTILKSHYLNDLHLLLLYRILVTFH